MSEAIAEKQKIFSHFPNIAYNVIGIAVSEGGGSALCNLVTTLPPDFPAAIVIVRHLSPAHPSYLPQILSRFTALRVKMAEADEFLRPGTIYTAAPAKHLLVKSDGTLAFSNAPRVNFSRPAADLLFRSLATSYKTRAIAVVLTGRNEDGALGVVAIKRHGGIVIAQDQATSECFNMPKAAIETGKVDWVLPLEKIGPILVNLVMTEQVA